MTTVECVAIPQSVFVYCLVWRCDYCATLNCGFNTEAVKIGLNSHIHTTDVYRKKSGPDRQTVLVWQVLVLKHSLTHFLMRTKEHWQVARHSAASPPERVNILIILLFQKFKSQMMAIS